MGSFLDKLKKKRRAYSVAIFLLAFVSMFALSACSKPDDTNEEKSQETSQKMENETENNKNLDGTSVEVPDEVACEAGRLADQEWAYIRETFPERSYAEYKLEAVDYVLTCEDVEGESFDVYGITCSYKRDGREEWEYAQNAANSYFVFRSTTEGLLEWVCDLKTYCTPETDDFEDALHEALKGSDEQYIFKLLADQSLDKALEQTLMEYVRHVVPGDYMYYGWKQLTQENAGESGIVYGILLFHTSSGSPLIFSEETGRYCSAIYSTYLLPISVSYEKDSKERYVVTDCWEPSEEAYEQDIIDRFPPETANLVLKNLDQYTIEILKEYGVHQNERVLAFFPGGPVWPTYAFDEALDNASLCGLASYYPVGDIYYEPVYNEVLRRFKDNPTALLDVLSRCNEETQSKVRSYIIAEIGVSELEAALRALQSEHEVQVPTEPPNKESTKPAAPPTDEDIRAALIANHASVEELHMGVPNTSTPFQTEGWLVLAEEDGTTTHTVYLLTHHAIYDLLGSGTQTKYEAAAFCHHATVLTFLWQDDRWQLLEYWLPGDGAYYEADTRATFPAEAVDKLFGDNASLYDNDVIRQCDDAAVRYYAGLTNWVPAKAFYPSDVEFSGQALYTSTDTMTYEERLAWAQAGEDNGNIWPACTGQYSEGEGCIAYVEKIVAGRYPDLSLRIRFADGMIAALSVPLVPNPSVNVLPDIMAFEDGKFIYEVEFKEELLGNEGQSLIHLKGTYHYEVDLVAKTVSLTVLQ